MARIRMLDEAVIGKIAAGEVVERPAAAIKELVENSLDAGATRISVEIQEGGIESFRVTDDGCGIDESDIRLAFERHATSKIRTAEDLTAVGTLGFRGEALASIAAVSRVTMTTRTPNRETGLRVTNTGGVITDLREVACAPGTGILVRDLFFNVPVRKGFLKKPSTEMNAVTDLMIRLILSRPDVSFRYLSNGKTIFHTAGDGKTENALLAIYGSSVVRTLRRVDGHQNGILMKGFVGIGENARGNRSGECFFINGRMLRSPLLGGALEDACRERVMIGRFPICALYLEMPFENVNVNVHPNKMEVRFRFDQSVREAVYSMVLDAIRDRDAFQRPVEMYPPEEQESGQEADISAQPAPGPVSAAEGGITYNRGTGSAAFLPKPRAEIATGSSVPDIGMREEPPMPVYRPLERNEQTASKQEISVPDELPRPALPHTDDMTVSPAGKTEKAEQLSSLPPDLPAPMRVFGAVFNTFILVEYADHLLLVDQHAVHERLLFDRMMKACEEHRAGQEMLVPYIVPVTRREMAVLDENRDILENLGLVVAPFSENEAAIRSVPVMLGQHEGAEFLREAIAELENGRIPGEEKKRAAILQTACKHAVKGGEPLPEDVLRSLVEEMIKGGVTPTCPHGRPLVVSISHRELDKKFKRIQD